MDEAKTEKLPKTYASWDNQSIASLIPAFADVLTDPDHIDPQQLREKVSEYNNLLYSKAGAILESDDFRKFQAENDPEALARVFHELENTLLEIRRIFFFFNLYDSHYSIEQAKNLQPILGLVQQSAGLGVFVSQTFQDIITHVASLGPEQVNEILSASEELKRFRTIINRYMTAPRADLNKLSLLANNAGSIGTATQKLQHIIQNPFNAPIEDRREAFAFYFAQIISHKHAEALAKGFPDTMMQFTFNNNAPHDLVSDLAAATEKRMPELADKITMISQLAKERLPKQRNPGNERFDWKTTQDIVCAAYAKCDPTLGALAKRAFEEGWIYAKNTGVVNSHTLGGVPVSQDSNGHPFALIQFEGKTSDVLVVAHEMGHLLSNYIAGEKQGALTQDASLFLQEIFSQFGEALLEEEMLKRTETPVEKARIHMVFATHEFGILAGAIPFITLEEELYALCKNSNADVTYDQMNALYQKHCSGAMKSLQNNRETELVDSTQLWHLLMQPPHTISVYPITKMISAALFEQYKNNPESFRKNYHDVMEAGSTTGIDGVWDRLLGKEMGKHDFVNKRLDKLTTKIAAITDELKALPVLPQNQQVEESIEKNASAPDPVVNEVVKEKTLKRTAGSGWQRGDGAKAIRKNSSSDNN